MERSKKPEVKFEDCNECRIIGSLTFTGVAGYLLYVRSTVRHTEKGQRFFLASFAVASAAIAAARAFY